MAVNLLKNLEMELHQPGVRKDSERVSQLLHREFIEIGYSGQTYDFDATLASILAKPLDYELWSQNYEYVVYNKSIVQVVYLSASVDGQGQLSRHAKRSSIWVNERSDWQMKFHQATPVLPFEKSSKG